MPEPRASQLVVDAGGKVLVDEKDLWPDGKFVTTHLIVATEFLDGAPGRRSRRCSRATSKTDEWIDANPDEAKTAVNAALEKLTGKALAAEVLDRGLENIEFTIDPLASTPADAADARGRGRAAQGARPEGHLRPDAAQQGARRPTADPSRRRRPGGSD